MFISYSFKDSLINQIKIYFLRKQKTKKKTQKRQRNRTEIHVTDSFI